MQGKVAYMRPKVVGSFPVPCASGSYMAALICVIALFTNVDRSREILDFLDTIKYFNKNKLLKFCLFVFIVTSIKN
jgi:hypothetical protein